MKTLYYLALTVAALYYFPYKWTTGEDLFQVVDNMFFGV